MNPTLRAVLDQYLGAMNSAAGNTCWIGQEEIARRLGMRRRAVVRQTQIARAVGALVLRHADADGGRAHLRLNYGYEVKLPARFGQGDGLEGPGKPLNFWTYNPNWVGFKSAGKDKVALPPEMCELVALMNRVGGLPPGTDRGPTRARIEELRRLFVDTVAETGTEGLPGGDSPAVNSVLQEPRNSVLEDTRTVEEEKPAPDGLVSPSSPGEVNRVLCSEQGPQAVPPDQRAKARPGGVGVSDHDGDKPLLPEVDPSGWERFTARWGEIYGPLSGRDASLLAEAWDNTILSQRWSALLARLLECPFFLGQTPGRNGKPFRMNARYLLAERYGRPRWMGMADGDGRFIHGCGRRSRTAWDSCGRTATPRGQPGAVPVRGECEGQDHHPPPRRGERGPPPGGDLGRGGAREAHGGPEAYAAHPQPARGGTGEPDGAPPSTARTGTSWAS